MKPIKVDAATTAFPASVGHLMPKYEDIPDEFKHRRNPWVKWQQGWFFSGLKGWPEPKDGIDIKEAMAHLSCIQRSFEPKHEHKEAAVAYLASLWFKEESAK